METHRFTSIDNKERYVAVSCGEVVDIKSEAHRKSLEYMDNMYQWSKSELIKHKDTPTDSILLPDWIYSLRKEKENDKKT